MKQIKFSICTASLFMLMSCVDLNLNPLSEGSSDELVFFSSGNRNVFE